MTKKKTSNVIIFCILCVLVVAFLTPIFFVLINSFRTAYRRDFCRAYQLCERY